MSKSSDKAPAAPQNVGIQDVNLKDRTLAGVLAFLLPGAGHLYQGRTAKAALFFICIMGTFAYGMFLGGGRVVYAQWSGDAKFKRWSFICQLGVGLPALPAVVAARQGNFLGTQYYVPPDPFDGEDQREFSDSTLNNLHKKYNRRFELGTAYTMIAGLLNVLVVYDACKGPAFGDESAPRSPPGPKGRKEDEDEGEAAKDKTKDGPTGEESNKTDD